ncbi:carbohydrate-binding module family 20 domain-containing protein [Saccharothrix sp. NPDC042600]|uniref:carbohydrate-binding module family 20 domain-containing protein n=1 Tax=Saccharothrix TaxID=2071 RepID=UPI0033F3E6E4|nr:hypothetical protein GCM10017745_49770 [Saccharothrix mutabilis subsp. capreolus]
MPVNTVRRRRVPHLLLPLIALVAAGLVPAPAAHADPVPSEPPPNCVAYTSGIRYTFVSNHCADTYDIQLRYTDGSVSVCRTSTPDSTITFPGYGFDHNYVVAIEGCDNVAVEQLVQFNGHVTTHWGQHVHVVGSIPALGSWDPDRAPRLSPTDYPVWTTSVYLPANTTFEYKYFTRNPDNTVTWMSGDNFIYTTKGSDPVVLHDFWR